MKTLVIHPEDPTTTFLNKIYEGRDWTVVTKRKEDISKKETETLIKEHDRIIMMGHGYPGGLFYTHINSDMVYLLQEKDCVCIWCNADQFVNRYGLKGFYTGMFISEVGEANWFDIDTTQKEIDFSNHFFTDLVSEFIDDENLHQILKESYITGSPVIQFNNDRLYYNPTRQIV